MKDGTSHKQRRKPLMGYTHTHTQKLKLNNKFGEEVTTSMALLPWARAGSLSCSKSNEAWVHCLVVPLVNQCALSFILNKSGPLFVTLKHHQRQHPHVDRICVSKSISLFLCASNSPTNNYHSYSCFSPIPTDTLNAFHIKDIIIIK